MKDTITVPRSVVEQTLAAMQSFVRKCDTGLARSKNSYRDFKAVLPELQAALDAPEPQPPQNHAWAAISKTSILLFWNKESAEKMVPTPTSHFCVERLPIFDAPVEAPTPQNLELHIAQLKATSLILRNSNEPVTFSAKKLAIADAIDALLLAVKAPTAEPLKSYGMQSIHDAITEDPSLATGEPVAEVDRSAAGMIAWHGVPKLRNGTKLYTFQPTAEPQPPVLTKAQARAILDMALDLEKTGRLVSLTEGQERSDFVARNRGIQCALEDYLRNLTEPPAHGIKEGS